VVSYSAPSNITATSATLNASINPEGQAATAYFEYGTSSNDLNQRTAAVSIGNGSSLVAFSQTLAA